MIDPSGASHEAAAGAQKTNSELAKNIRPEDIRAASVRKARRRSARRRQQLLWLTRALCLAVVLLAWQLSASSGVVPEAFTSEPSHIGKDLWDFITTTGSWDLLGTTLFETLVGFFLSVLLGLIGGFILYQSRFFADMVRPFISATNALPKIALAPLFVLWFGLGSESRIILVISLDFFIILINTYAGLQNSDRDLLLLGKSLGASRLTLLRKCVLPGAIPTLVAGFQLALTYAFIAAIVGEMLSGNGGLGAEMSLNLASYHTGRFFAELTVLLLAATVAASLMTILERRLLRWRVREVRGLVA